MFHVRKCLRTKKEFFQAKQFCLTKMHYVKELRVAKAMLVITKFFFTCYFNKQSKAVTHAKQPISCSEATTAVVASLQLTKQPLGHKARDKSG